MLIELNNVNAGYGSRTVLHDVSLSFDGGCAGLLGPNGAGKSTLLKTLLGFIPPLSGSVQVLGYPLPAGALEVRARMGYMPETESFIPGMNAVNFVAYMAQLSGLPRSAAMERSHEVLQYVGLGESRYRNLETYSLGMKQRAKLAQAIVHDPAILLLDEPTNGLDPTGRQEMLDLVSDLSRNKGMSVILCSHLLKDVEFVAQEIIVLGGGRINSKQIRTQDSTQPAMKLYFVRVRGNETQFATALRESGYVATVAPGDSGFVVEIAREHPQGTSGLFAAAARSGCTIQRLEPRSERLEDVFLQAVGELQNAHL